MRRGNKEMLFVHDHKFLVKDKKIFTAGTLTNELFERYEKIFGKVVVFANKIQVNSKQKCKTEVTNKEMYLYSPQNILGIKKIKKIIFLLKNEKYIILRLPSINGILFGFLCLFMQKKYFVELVGCPYDAFKNHGTLGKIAAPVISYFTKIIVNKASHCLYVTKSFLQKRYPTSGKSIGCSDVVLRDVSDEILRNRIRKIKESNLEKIVVGTLAAVDMKYKGQQYVIEAFGRLKEQGITNFQYQLIGYGNDQYLRRSVEKAGVESQVFFAGGMPHDRIFEWLESIDVYIQPSLVEGLPRTVVEAMSMGVPIIGTRVGGIPELISHHMLVRPKNINDIVNSLKRLNIELLCNEAKLNFYNAKEYYPETLNKIREDFYMNFREGMDENLD